MPDAVDAFLGKIKSGAVASPLNESALAPYPEPIRKLARQLVEYTIPLPGGVGMSKAPWPQALEAAGALDPGPNGFDYKQYATRQNFQKQWAELKNTSAGGKIATANKLISHLSELMDASDQLHNKSVEPWNYLANAFESKIEGKPEVNNFRTAASHVGEETANFFSGGGAGSEGQRAANRQAFDENASPDIQKGAAKTTIKLVSGQIAPYREQYIKVMGRPPKDPILDEKSRAVINRLGLDPNEIETGVPEVAPVNPFRK